MWPGEPCRQIRRFMALAGQAYFSTAHPGLQKNKLLIFPEHFFMCFFFPPIERHLPADFE